MGEKVDELGKMRVGEIRGSRRIEEKFVERN